MKRKSQKTSQQSLGELWRLFPHTFAERASLGKWVVYPYLKYISEKVAEAISRGNGRIIVSLPPRHGKTELLSIWLPFWFLDLFPSKHVILAAYESEFASDLGRRVRDEISQNPFVSFPPIEGSGSKYIYS